MYSTPHLDMKNVGIPLGSMFGVWGVGVAYNHENPVLTYNFDENSVLDHMLYICLFQLSQDITKLQTQ